MLGQKQIAVHISEESVMPALSPEGPGFQFAHVDVILGEEIQDSGKGAGLIGQGEEHGCLHLSGRGAWLPAANRAQFFGGVFVGDDDEARPVAGFILYAPGQNVQAQQFGKIAVADGGRSRFLEGAVGGLANIVTTAVIGTLSQVEHWARPWGWE